jgi:hypothetical protein
VADIYYFIPKRELDDVRWEKVEQVRRILTGGTYPVSPEQIAAKLIEQMLERGRVNLHWRRSKSRGKAIDSSGVDAATIAGKARKHDGRRSGRKLTRRTASRDKVTCRGNWGGYEVSAWRYANDASWHLKVWPAGHPSEWIGYSMTAGVFEPETADQTHKEAAFHVISMLRSCASRL